MKPKPVFRQRTIPPLLLRFLVKRPDRDGFTLIELLVSMLIASFMVSGLLYLVVEILQTNQRDASRSDTQRDLQMAMDYIVRDVREATYVYGVDASGAGKTSCLAVYGKSIATTRGVDGKCTGLLDFLPSFLQPPAKLGDKGNYPVLAFWKPEPLPVKIRDSCKKNFAKVGDIGNDALNDTPCVSQRMYTLVVYSLSTEDAKSFNWKGKARIKRYQLPHFTEEADLGIINKRWSSPIAKDKRPLTWPIGDKVDSKTSSVTPATNTQLEPTDPVLDVRDLDNVVLTDFLDSEPIDYKPGHCPNGFDSPSGLNEKTFNAAFYVCVNPANLPGINPEVNIVMRGNAAGRGGILKTGNLPFQMETRVLSRGVYSKEKSQ